MHRKRKKDLHLSITSSLLLFFNYLIVLYWLTYFVIQLVRNQSGQFSLARWLELFFSNTTFFICLLLIVIYFYQPGQGVRGSLFDGGYFVSFYYILLNFISVDNRSQIFNFFQFSLAATSLLVGFFICISNVCNKNAPMRGLSLFALIFFGIFGIFDFLNLLALAPSRHILFTLPIIYILVANSLNIINIKNIYLICVAPIVISYLFMFMSYRNDQLQDNSQALSSVRDLESYAAVIVKDCSANLYYSKTLRGMRVFYEGSNKLEPGKYLYLSQTKDFLLTDFIKNNKANEPSSIFYYSPIIKVEANFRFLPYSPNNYAHDRPNNFYAYAVSVAY